MIFLTMVNKVEVSHKTIIFTVVLLMSLWVVVQIRDIIILLFVSFVLMAALTPIIDKLEQKRIPRTIAILIIYAVLLSIMTLIGTLIVPPLVNQTVHLVSGLPAYIQSIAPEANIQINTILQQIIPVGGGVIRFSLGVFTNIIAFVTFLVFTFYFLLERKKLNGYLNKMIGKEAGKRFFHIVEEIEFRLGAWVRGELLLMLTIGILTYVGLTIIGINYALPLALIAGLLEIVPIVGPIISAVPAILVGLTVSPGFALVVVALYIIIQQLENSVVVPAVMRKAVGLSPLITILALMIGARLAGIGGALLSIPLVLVLDVVVRHLLHKENLEDTP